MMPTIASEATAARAASVSDSPRTSLGAGLNAATRPARGRNPSVAVGPAVAGRFPQRSEDRSYRVNPQLLSDMSVENSFGYRTAQPSLYSLY
jgi:hypothetical protein